MSIDKSLRRKNQLQRARNVLNRGERIKQLQDEERPAICHQKSDQYPRVVSRRGHRRHFRRAFRFFLCCQRGRLFDKGCLHLVEF